MMGLPSSFKISEQALGLSKTRSIEIQLAVVFSTFPFMNCQPDCSFTSCAVNTNNRRFLFENTFIFELTYHRNTGLPIPSSFITYAKHGRLFWKRVDVVQRVPNNQVTCGRGVFTHHLYVKKTQE